MMFISKILGRHKLCHISFVTVSFVTVSFVTEQHSMQQRNSQQYRPGADTVQKGRCKDNKGCLRGCMKGIGNVKR